MGSLIGGVLAGVGAQVLGTYFGNKLVPDDEHFRQTERAKQYKEALIVMGLKDAEITRDVVERKRKILAKMYHPDHFREKDKQDAHVRFISLSAAYYVILFEKGYLSAPTVPVVPLQLQ